MTESDIKISTFCTNIFRQFCYISFSNYLVQKRKKKTEQEESLEGAFWTRRDFASQNRDKPAPPKILIAVSNSFLPVIKFKFYFETKTPVF